MPVDHKRINGPDVSVPYRVYSKVHLKTHEEKSKEILNQSGKRKDGRKPNESRKICMKTMPAHHYHWANYFILSTSTFVVLKCGVISRAKGSAYIELGRTKVIVAVFDPREIPKQNKYSVNGELYCDLKFSPFACAKRRSPQTDAEEKSLAFAMKRALEPAVCRHEFPNFQVDIFANVLQDDGSVLGAAITCAGLALADAGIPMYDLITASTVSIADGTILMDPTMAEEDVSSLCGQQTTTGDHGLMMMSKLYTHDQISELWQSGSLSLQMIQTVSQMVIAANNEMVPIVKQILLKKIMKNIKNSERSLATVEE